MRSLDCEFFRISVRPPGALAKNLKMSVLSKMEIESLAFAVPAKPAELPSSTAEANVLFGSATVSIVRDSSCSTQRRDDAWRIQTSSCVHTEVKGEIREAGRFKGPAPVFERKNPDRLIPLNLPSCGGEQPPAAEAPSQRSCCPRWTA